MGMIDSSELVDGLEYLGLSRTEARVYLAVVRHERTAVDALASAVDAPESRVRRVCDRLEAKGLVAIGEQTTETTVRTRFAVDVPDERAVALAAALSTVNRQYGQRTAFETVDVLESGEAVVDRTVDLLARADEEISIATSAASLPELIAPLERALDRGVLVLLAVGDGGSTADYAAGGAVVNTVAYPLPTVVTVDKRRGVVSPTSIPGAEHADIDPIAFDNFTVASKVLAFFLGTLWRTSTERALRRPCSLPHTYGPRFWKAVLDATLYLRDDQPIRVQAAVGSGRADDEPETVTGRVVDTRQTLIEPTTGEFPLENGLTLETDAGTVSLGGSPGAFKETYEARSVTLLEDP